ncbi:MAG: YncE family protein [Chitinophagales bacterium]
MKKFISLITMMLVCNLIFAQTGMKEFRIIKTIKVPGDDKWDFSAVDEKYQHLFLSHETRVQILDLKTDSLIGEIPNTTGVHGIAFAYDLDRGFTSNGDANSVTMFNLRTFEIIKTIPITGKDPDAILYDSFTRQVFTFNADSRNSTVINAKTGEVVKTIDLDGSPEFAVTDNSGKIFLNLEKESQLLVINTKTFAIESRWPLAPCEGPTGLALDATNHRLFTGCRGNKGLTVLDATSGKIITTLQIGVVVDAVCYDVQRKLIFVSNGDGTLNIFHQDSPDAYSSIQTLTTKPRSKTMALNQSTRLAYLSSADFTQDKKVVPGTFAVLVVGN